MYWRDADHRGHNSGATCDAKSISFHQCVPPFVPIEVFFTSTPGRPPRLVSAVIPSRCTAVVFDHPTHVVTTVGSGYGYGLV
jgi:hypothetical protein